MKSFKGALGQCWFLTQPGHMLLVQNEDALETSMFGGFLFVCFQGNASLLVLEVFLRESDQGTLTGTLALSCFLFLFFSNVFSLFFSFKVLLKYH